MVAVAASLALGFKSECEIATSSEGVDVLENRPFEDNVYGKGYYTLKVYRFQSKIPTWIRTIAAADLAGNNLIGKDFKEAFDVACFPLTLISSSFYLGWSCGASATVIHRLLDMLVEGGP